MTKISKVRVFYKSQEKKLVGVAYHHSSDMVQQVFLHQHQTIISLVSLLVQGRGWVVALSDLSLSLLLNLLLHLTHSDTS